MQTNAVTLIIATFLAFGAAYLVWGAAQFFDLLPTVKAVRGRSIPPEFLKNPRLKNIFVSALKGEAASQCELGLMFLAGEVLPKNAEMAVRWLRRAEKSGCAEASHNLGVVFETGDGVTPDRSRAVKHYEKAAKLGFAPAQFNLGNLLVNTSPKNVDARYFREGLQLLETAASQGHRDAAYNLGCIFESILGDSVAAEGWFKKASLPADTPE
ncbi:MAG TPA: tetratricopeptide repeat protein [Thermoanaerobaculia bacterium]|nr:tetratricopeptide repeat protein [Thermoanaerobaculia bacterium]